MNLAERRVVADFEANQYPALKTRVEEAAGTAVPIEVKWETLATPGESRLYAEAWPQVYFEPLIGGLKTVCRDAAGLAAVKAGVKQIVIQNTSGCSSGDRWAGLAEGVLTLDHEAVVNIGDGEQRKAGLVAMLEATL